ncbi:MAG: hypothetical protein R2856_09395 [Caldilineaceae bacterium]
MRIHNAGDSRHALYLMNIRRQDDVSLFGQGVGEVRGSLPFSPTIRVAKAPPDEDRHLRGGRRSPAT